MVRIRRYPTGARAVIVWAGPWAFALVREPSGRWRFARAGRGDPWEPPEDPGAPPDAGVREPAGPDPSSGGTAQAAP